MDKVARGLGAPSARPSFVGKYIKGPLRRGKRFLKTLYDYHAAQQIGEGPNVDYYLPKHEEGLIEGHRGAVDRRLENFGTHVPSKGERTKQRPEYTPSRLKSIKETLLDKQMEKVRGSKSISDAISGRLDRVALKYAPHLEAVQNIAAVGGAPWMMPMYAGRYPTGKGFMRTYNFAKHIGENKWGRYDPPVAPHEYQAMRDWAISKLEKDPTQFAIDEENRYRSKFNKVKRRILEPEIPENKGV
jgi:hypothetical protein